MIAFGCLSLTITKLGCIMNKTYNLNSIGHITIHYMRFGFQLYIFFWW